jgi:hypothetical protein
MSDWSNALMAPRGAYSTADVNNALRDRVVERGFLAPLATYGDGSTRAAVPGILADPVNAWYDLLQSPYRAGARDEANRNAIGNALTAAGGAMTGGLLSPKPSNSLGTFGGRMARTADHAALARAEDMAARGIPREQIWNDTGWFKGVDGKWRFEIDDRWSGIDWKREKKPFNHPMLEEAYPKALTSYVLQVPGDGFSGGSHTYLTTGRSYITIADDAKNPRSSALHEFQHHLQNVEGFANGASPDNIPKDIKTKFMKDTGDPGWDNAMAAMRAYNNVSGEVEARAVQKRANMTPAERRARHPWLDYDVPESDQIVMFR